MQTAFGRSFAGRRMAMKLRALEIMKRQPVESICLLLIGGLQLAVAASETNPPARPAKALLPPPTFGNVKYGPHERNVLDFWQARAEAPTPLVLYIHGGGWRSGDKTLLIPGTLKTMLAHQVSVASINYRYSTQAKLPAPVHDAARALQFIRSQAPAWNLDKTHIAAMGVSAGACTTLWLAYHEDLAEPQSQDPVARESTRLWAAVSIQGQTAIDPELVVPWVGEQIMNHGMLSCAVGATNAAEARLRYPEYRALYHEFSPINHVSRGGPPVLLFYLAPAPLPATTPGIAIHHAIMGQKLKERADAAGLVCELKTATKTPEDAPVVNEFLLELLTKGEAKLPAPQQSALTPR
jgi:acetyl esterase/lipase